MEIKTKFNVGDEVWKKAYLPHKCECCDGSFSMPGDVESVRVKRLNTETESGGKTIVTYCLSDGCYRGDSHLYGSQDEARKALNLPKDKPTPKLCPNCAKYIKEMCLSCAEVER